MIEAETKKLEEAAETTVRYFHENGFACQILKGCSVGRYYPNPLTPCLSAFLRAWAGSETNNGLLLCAPHGSRFLDEPSGKAERKVKDNAETVKWIKKLGMERFAKGLMWVLREYFGLDEKYLLFEPDQKEGRFIMQEVMLTGNMGHSDKRHWGSLKSPLSRFFFNLRRDLYLAKHCPHEAQWQPFFSIWLYFWRLSKGLLSSED